MVSSRNDNPVCVALTGASGFLGGQVLNQLLESGFHVRALQNTKPLLPHQNLEIISGSLLDKAALKDLVDGATHIIHCGGIVAAKNKLMFQQINAQGTQNLIKATQNKEAPKFLYISSMAAREPEISPYASSKREGEEILKRSALSQWDIIRPPAIYGEGDVQLLPLLKLLKCRIALLIGGKQAQISVIHVSDMADAIHSWVKTDKTSGQCYEIDDGQQEGHTWHSLLGEAAKAMDKKPFYVTPPLFLMKFIGSVAQIIGRICGKAPFITVDKLSELSHPDWLRHDDRIEETLNWAPKVSFSEGITKTLDWYKQKEML